MANQIIRMDIKHVMIKTIEDFEDNSCEISFQAENHIKVLVLVINIIAFFRLEYLL